MKIRLSKFVSGTGVLFLFATAVVAQSVNGVPTSSQFAPSSEPSSAPPRAEAPKKEEPLSDREKALLNRVEQLEKRLAEVEALLKKPTTETGATELTKPLAQTDLASAATPAVSPQEQTAQVASQKKKKSELRLLTGPG